MKAAYLTLGCRVNQYETQVIREALSAHGFSEADAEEASDVYLVNTCAVTAESTRKGRQLIRRLLRKKEENPSAVVCVCGCFSQGEGDDGIFSGVDILCGNAGKSRLAAAILEMVETPLEKRRPLDLRQDISKVRQYEPMSLSYSHNARAFVKIQDGCNSFCSYCYVPLVRGRVRSRPQSEILAEVERLTAHGYREIVLTGIETGSYGEDLAEGESLLSLVKALHAIPDAERIRFGSLKPSIFTEDFCKELSQMERVMPHFHLSLQSGSDAVLSRMHRRYGRKEEREAVEAILRFFPDAGLSADLICGFPGETESDFLETVSLVRESGLLHTHIFPFSPREGTLAAKMEGAVSQAVKRYRCEALLAEAKESSLRFARSRVGKEYRVLCERVRDGKMLGYTENFLYTATEGVFPFRVGRIYRVRLQEPMNFSVETLTVSAKCEEIG